MQKEVNALTMLKPIVLLLAIIGLLFGHQHLFFSHEVRILVTENDAPRFCRQRGTSVLSRLFYTTERSETPNGSALGYCGVIRTDRGYYKLPQDKYTSLFDAPRAELDDALREGCRFRVEVVGYGKVVQYGEKPRVPVIQHISRIIEPLGCQG